MIKKINQKTKKKKTIVTIKTIEIKFKILICSSSVKNVQAQINRIISKGTRIF